MYEVFCSRHLVCLKWSSLHLVLNAKMKYGQILAEQIYFPCLPKHLEIFPFADKLAIKSKVMSQGYFLNDSLIGQERLLIYARGFAK